MATDPEVTSHTGRELELMAAGKKPLAMFYAEVGALPHEELIPENGFAPYVRSGVFVRGETSIFGSYHPRLQRNVEIRYVFYALREEAWRIPAMVLVLKQHLKLSSASEAMDRITGALLGYTDEEIDAYCASVCFSMSPRG